MLFSFLLLFIGLASSDNISTDGTGFTFSKDFDSGTQFPNEKDQPPTKEPITKYVPAQEKPEHTPPFTDANESMPHYDDLISPDIVLTTPNQTLPGQEPVAPGTDKTPENTNDKLKQMDPFREDGKGMPMTTSHGARISDNQNTLKAGERGPALLEDFHFVEKLAHFDRERIPERVVHARGSGAHGHFQVYRSLANITKAAFLQDPAKKTPVFVRFSTVQGFRGSPDTVRDIRGFATKLYTEEGNHDIVGINTPVFFIQDAIKFPDFVHAVKPEPATEMPQGGSAHDSFWDYVSLQPETLHNVMWAMSDRGIPRSYRTMEGFGIHTFKLVNAAGNVTFCRFHWKPTYGLASFTWDEAQQISGRNFDYHRLDLWQAIEAGDYPEWELGLQLIPEGEETKLGFDILDPTKLIPEAVIPVTLVGKMTLNRNPDNFFAETEQVAFCPANVVPGVEFSNDPLLQGRTFAYTDTQRHRLGGANFNQIPINSPISPTANHQRDGMHTMPINRGPNYEPNTIGHNYPRETPPSTAPHPHAMGGHPHAMRGHPHGMGGHPHAMGGHPHGLRSGMSTVPEAVSGVKERVRSPSFGEYYSHPRLFYRSLTPPEQRHTAEAFAFELGKVSRHYIRERVIDLLTRVDVGLAGHVAALLGIELTQEQATRPPPPDVEGLSNGDDALSLYKKNVGKVKGRRVNVVVADGVCGESVATVKKLLLAEGIYPMIVGPRIGPITTCAGADTTPENEVIASDTFFGNPSVLVDAVVVVGGTPGATETLVNDPDSLSQVQLAYRHLKPISFIGSSKAMLTASGITEDAEDKGLIIEEDAATGVLRTIEALKEHRIWSREEKKPKVMGF